MIVSAGLLNKHLCVLIFVSMCVAGCTCMSVLGILLSVCFCVVVLCGCVWFVMYGVSVASRQQNHGNPTELLAI